MGLILKEKLFASMVAAACGTAVGKPAVPPAVPSSALLTELARHNTEKDCWIMVDGQLYDISAYVTKHSQPKQFILPYCGKDASQAWHTKAGQGRDHSPKAKEWLKGLAIREGDHRRP